MGEQMRQMRNRFANEFDEAVPEAIIELPSSSSEDSDDIDDDFYDRKKDRDVKGRYTIPHRRGPSGSPLRDMVRRTEAEINAEVRKKKPKAPPGIPEKQWQGKSDLEKLRDRYRERDWDEMEGRFADTSHCVREEGEISSRRKNSRDEEDSGNSTDSGLQQIKADSITIGGMSERDILKMNDKLYNVEHLKREGNRQERLYRLEGLYYDHMGRRRYR